MQPLIDGRTTAEELCTGWGLQQPPRQNPHQLYTSTNQKIPFCQSDRLSSKYPLQVIY